MPDNVICPHCNSSFSKFEKKVLQNSVLGLFRSKNAVATKKGKPSRFQIGNLKGQEHDEFIKNRMIMNSIPEENILNVDPATMAHTFTMPSFDKSEVATSKLLLKMGMESFYKSKKQIYLKHDFHRLRELLTNRSNMDWPFILSNANVHKFVSIPLFQEKYNLNKIQCHLKFVEVENYLLFKFEYSSLAFVINLLNRELGWTNVFFEGGSLTSLWPNHFHAKLKAENKLKEQ